MLGDAKIATQQGLCHGDAEANNYFRMECGDFGFEPRPTGRYFCCIWFFMNAAFSSRFPLEVFYRVGDVNFFAVNASSARASSKRCPVGPTNGLPFKSS
jgi:hypothetical protein